MGREPILHDGRGVSTGLAAEERPQPRTKEENAAMLLNEPKRVERRAQEGQRQRLVFERIELSQGSRRPVLVQVAVGKIAVEVL